MDKQHIKEIAATVVEQLGGFKRLNLFAGVPYIFYGEEEFNGFKQPYIDFMFKGSKRVNNCRIIYEEGKDLYVVHFNKSTVKRTMLIKEFTEVYAEDLISLFENATGLVFH